MVIDSVNICSLYHLQHCDETPYEFTVRWQHQDIRLKKGRRTYQMKTVVALFEHIDDAYHAVDALKNAEFTRDDISVISQDANNEYSRYLDKGDKGEHVGDGAGTGAGIGAVLGGLGGFLLSIGALAIPGVGPIIAAGPILATLTGAGVGAVAGGVVGALVGLGIPEDDAHTFAEGVKRGGTLVVVHTQDGLADRAASILDRFSPVDISENAENLQDWTATGTGQNRNLGQREYDRTYRQERENIPVTGEEDFGQTKDALDEDVNDADMDYPHRSRVYTHHER
jgi:hypothetical protein